MDKHLKIQSAINYLQGLFVENLAIPNPAILYVENKQKHFRVFFVFPYTVVPLVYEVTEKAAIILSAKIKDGHIVYPLGKSIFHQQLRPTIVGINEPLTPIFLT